MDIDFFLFGIFLNSLGIIVSILLLIRSSKIVQVLTINHVCCGTQEILERFYVSILLLLLRLSPLHRRWFKTLSSLAGQAIDFILENLFFRFLLLKLTFKVLDLPLEVGDGGLLRLQRGLELAHLISHLVDNQVLASDSFYHLAHLSLTDRRLLGTGLSGRSKLIRHISELGEDMLLLCLYLLLSLLDLFNGAIAFNQFQGETLQSLIQVCIEVLLLLELIVDLFFLEDMLINR